MRRKEGEERKGSIGMLLSVLLPFFLSFSCSIFDENCQDFYILKDSGEVFYAIWNHSIVKAVALPENICQEKGGKCRYVWVFTSYLENKGECKVEKL
ncbi:MAG: hypothetical protein ABGX27_04195, partial [Desulfurobacteriaceae bacterium]